MIQHGQYQDPETDPSQYIIIIVESSIYFKQTAAVALFYCKIRISDIKKTTY